MHRYTLQFILILSIGFSSSWVGLSSKADKSVKPSVISSTIEESYLHFEFNGYHAIEVETPNGLESIIDLEGGSSILEAGSPDLDKWTSSIIISDEGTTSVEIISSSYHDFYDVSVAPSKGNFSRLINPEDVAYTYEAPYQLDNFYPGTLAELQDPYILRDLRGQTVVIYPLQYNPITKILRLYTQIDLKIITVGSSGENVLSRVKPTESVSKEYNAIYQDLFLNYANDTRFNYVFDEGSMLVISYGDFMDEMQPFVDWKNRKGIPTEMVNVSSVGSTSSSIESYVDDYYHDNGLTYLLLVGDIAQIPSPTLSGSASDPSYGFIDGNDYYSEIIVGRFSGNNPSEISTQVERSIEYELEPQGGASWYDNALGIASNQGPGYGGMTDDDFNEFLWDTLLEDYYYDSYQGIYDGSGGTDSQGITAINNGVSLINYTGHGSISSWGNGASLSSSQINSLTNDNKLPFVITVGCNVGEFQSTSACFAETWQRATNGGEPTGSIVHFGSTISQSWEPPMHGQWAMNAILTESYDNHITRSIGGLTTNGCMHMNEAQGSSGINETKYWTFFGDPSIVIRTDQPTTLAPTHDDVILIGQTEFVVDVGVDGALAALSRDGELIGSSYSNGGVSVISLGSNADEPGEMDLVITAYNKFPYESSVTVLSPDGAFVTVNNVDIDYGSDNTITAGETIDITVAIENLGNEQSSLVEISLIELIDNPYITILDGSGSVDNLLDGSMAYIDLSFNVSSSAPYGHAFALQLELESEENNWSSTLNMAVEALVESFESASFDNLAWSLSGNAEWSIDSQQFFEGGYSARSGTIGDNTISTIELTMDIVENGPISFYKRVSCEDVGSTSGNYYDYLVFYVDDVEQDRWAGEVSWSQNSYNVSAGERTFKWTFIKDQDSGDVDSGEDAVWIDNIIFPPVSSGSTSMLGDVNNDGTVNVLDVIIVVNMALGSEEPNYDTADINGDGSIDILDIVQIVNIILDGRLTEDATHGFLMDTDGLVTLDSDGFIGGVQMTLSHGDNFSIELTSDALYADYITRDNETILIIAAPYTKRLFTLNGDYEIKDMIIANSQEQIRVMTPQSISLDAAYPNPFNPSTTMRLFIPTEGIVDVKIYNVMGQQVGVLHDGLMSSGYTDLTWDASSHSSGMYIVRVISEGYTVSQKVMLLK